MLSDRERCLPADLRSVFVAEVTLEGGNSIQRGKPLKGRVAIHATNGSTKMSDVSVSFTHTKHHPWAVDHARTSGDPDFDGLLCQWSGMSSEIISVEPSSYIFKKKDDDDSSVWSYTNLHPSRHGPLTAAKPYLDFELPIPTTAVPNFLSYYSSAEAVLGLSLTVTYSRDAANCIDGANGLNKYDAFEEPEDERTADDVSRKEDGLWDSYTPVGEPIQSHTLWRRTLRLTATVPLVVLGDISERPAEHYLTPGQPSPVILASPADVVFPPVRPVITEEPLANTSARLMRAEGTFDPIQSRRNFNNHTLLFAQDTAPNPAARYNNGDYVGLLWKKKVVAEERGILSTIVQGEGQDSQHRFVVAP
ncbi:60S ribosomal protein [Mycena venus]|uniref:60S ribosomal protein n=1 Tax=Mycena venus TaxID=2733690 RepID=A0A8H6X545_9AGAR|nr:60S ribosomal protein [Mycena venus]